MELCFVYLLSYFTRISCWFHFVCGATAFNTLWAQMEVSLSVGDRPNGSKKSYCLGYLFAFFVRRSLEIPEDIRVLWGEFDGKLDGWN